MIIDVTKRPMDDRGATDATSAFYQTGARAGRRRNDRLGPGFINKRAGYLQVEIFSSLMLMDIRLLSASTCVQTHARMHARMYVCAYGDTRARLSRSRESKRRGEGEGEGATRLNRRRGVVAKRNLSGAITRRVLIEDDYRFT